MLMATSAFAIVDPDPDMMGFYFDLEADLPFVDDVPLYSQVPMYLILTRPTADMIYGFEAGFTLEGDGIILNHSFAVDDYINVGTFENMIIGFGVPLPTTPATLLVTYSVLYMDSSMSALDFYLHGTIPSSINPLYPVILLADGVLQGVGLSAEFGPTAQINGGGMVVSTDNVSFDGIKSLYR